MPGTGNDLTQLFHWDGINFDRWGQVDCMGQKHFLKWIMDIYDETLPKCDGDRSRLDVDLLLRRRGLEWHRFLMARQWGKEILCERVKEFRLVWRDGVVIQVRTEKRGDCLIRFVGDKASVVGAADP